MGIAWARTKVLNCSRNLPFFFCRYLLLFISFLKCFLATKRNSTKEIFSMEEIAFKRYYLKYYRKLLNLNMVRTLTVVQAKLVKFICLFVTKQQLALPHQHSTLYLHKTICLGNIYRRFIHLVRKLELTLNSNPQINRKYCYCTDVHRKGHGFQLQKFIVGSVLSPAY